MYGRLRRGLHGALGKGMGGGGGERLIVQRQGKGRSVWCHIPPGTAAGEGEASGKEAQAAPGYFLG